MHTIGRGPRRDKPLYLPLGIFVGFALAMLVDSLMHAVAFAPAEQVDIPPLFDMTVEALEPRVYVPPGPWGGDEAQALGTGP